MQKIDSTLCKLTSRGLANFQTILLCLMPSDLPKVGVLHSAVLHEQCIFRKNS